MMSRKRKTRKERKQRNSSQTALCLRHSDEDEAATGPQNPKASCRAANKCQRKICKLLHPFISLEYFDSHLLHYWWCVDEKVLNQKLALNAAAYLSSVARLTLSCCGRLIFSRAQTSRPFSFFAISLNLKLFLFIRCLHFDEHLLVLYIFTLSSLLYLLWPIVCCVLCTRASSQFMIAAQFAHRNPWSSTPWFWNARDKLPSLPCLLPANQKFLQIYDLTNQTSPWDLLNGRFWCLLHSCAIVNSA